MTDEATDELKALVVQARQEKLGPFPETLRQRLLRYASERWQAGVSVKAVAEELGISVATLAYWRARATAVQEPKLRPVKVVEKPERGHVAFGPCGTSVRDLSLDEVAELFRKLS
jgi:transposase-like protein